MSSGTQLCRALSRHSTLRSHYSTTSEKQGPAPPVPKEGLVTVEWWDLRGLYQPTSTSEERLEAGQRDSREETMTECNREKVNLIVAHVACFYLTSSTSSEDTTWG